MDKPLVQLSDFVGEHGPYQLFLTISLFIRYVFLGLMANSGPLMTPDVTFYCRLPMQEVAAIMPNISQLNETERELEIKEEFKRICQIDLHQYTHLSHIYLNSSRPTFISSIGDNSKDFIQNNNATTRIRECTDFTYDHALDQGRTMTSEFDLVCEREWLRSLFQSLISAAIVVAHVFWGTFSDKYGRYKAQKICLIISLAAGCLSIFATDFWTFVFARALCSFGDLGFVVSLTTEVVELVGNQYRGLSVAIVNFGFALGVTIFPYIVAYFEDFRVVIMFTVLCHLITMPFILVTNESIRWLLINRRFKSAKKELKRILRWNKRSRALLRPFKVCIHFSRRPYVKEEEKFGDENNSASFCRISVRGEKRQTFELLFEKLIAQIESQNLCDPLGDAAPSPSLSRQSESPSNSSPEPPSERDKSIGPTDIKTQTVPESVLVVQPGAISDPHGGEISLRQENELTLRASSLEQVQQQASEEFNLEKPRTQTPLADETRTINSMLTDHSSKTIALKRSVSCHQLKLTYDVCAPEHSIIEKVPRGRSCSEMLSSGLLRDKDKRDQGFLHEQDEDEMAALSLRKRRTETCQPDCINIVAHQLSFMTRVSRLFKDKSLMLVVFTVVWTTFNSELQYTSYIIINLEVGEDIYLNYILGGCMEALAAISASILLSYSPRRASLITFWLLISASCFGLSVAHIDSTWAVWLLALAKFSQSCLSSIASVVAYESFPTFLRQSGSGLVFTLGMMGSVFAPLIFAEFDDQAGMDRVLMTFSFSSLTAAILIYLYLKETRNCELQ